MRIVIDMQGAQTLNRTRGIGRYTMGFTQAIVRNQGKNEIILALSGLFPDTIESIREAFDGLLPQENIRVWHTPGPVAYLNGNNTMRREAAKRVREAFLASLKPDVIHVTSLFEGFVDDGVTSIGILSGDIFVSVTLYDLIPLIYQKPYLENPIFKTWYLEKIEYLKRADLWLAISESSRQEGINYLGLPENRSVNTSADTDPQFRPVQISHEQECNLRQKYGLTKPYVMYTGGIDHRKNIEGLIRGYAKLPLAIRCMHQLAIVCSVQPDERQKLEQLTTHVGLTNGEVVLTGFVHEKDLIALYNLCKLFVFPSWHEGFGLPALEAMRCGAPVIGANTSSLPEVIGWDEALFDPHSDEAISTAIMRALINEDYRQALIEHGKTRAQKFSWDESARRAITAMEQLYKDSREKPAYLSCPKQRHRLAYISPLPPERSGISDYSAELIPELARYYDIDVIVSQKDISDLWIRQHCPIRTVHWFMEHSRDYDRILYHFGNSIFHQYMFGMLDEVPGVVVLHDFFLSGIIANVELCGIAPGFWTRTLYDSHGYSALKDRYNAQELSDVIWKYPCSLSVIQRSLGIIVHSITSVELANRWFGACNEGWSVIPHLRTPIEGTDKTAARHKIGFRDNDLVVCSFGILGPHKLNHRLLKAWLNSSLAQDKTCHLVFVGGEHDYNYKKELLAIIASNEHNNNIRFTGWIDKPVFRQYLAAADIGVQLRTLSRGETSGAVLDCMNYGLATIVNANGSMTDLPDEAIWKLPDEFSDTQLIEALETLKEDENKRRKLSEAARDTILHDHHPSKCAEMYRDAIERYYHIAGRTLPVLPYEIANIEETYDDQTLKNIAIALAKTFPFRNQPKQILVDISELVQRDVKTGIQRVVRGILKAWLTNPPTGYRVEPIYGTKDQGYRYARRFTLSFMDCPEDALQDEPIDYAPGDIFFALDLQPHIQRAQRGFYKQLRQEGVAVFFMVYDLLCITMPQYFLPGGEEDLTRWLEVVTECDGAICISKATANDLVHWIEKNPLLRLRPFKIAWSHIGADIDYANPWLCHSTEAEAVLSQTHLRPSFLMVGTLEPRKAHALVLDAFEALWCNGQNVNLVIVGKQGWMVEELVTRLRSHPELGKRLFWLEGISDEYLEKVYAACTCLIAASYGEGFGLPLIEAAQHKLPIIARDIPVFREVAKEHAFYFPNKNSAEAMATAVREWLKLYKEGRHPRSDNMVYLTWKESAQNLLDIILNDKWAYKILPDTKLKAGIIQTHRSRLLMWDKGWSEPEKQFRWTDGYKAIISFLCSEEDARRCGAIRIKFHTLGKQHIVIDLNGQTLFDEVIEGEQELRLTTRGLYEGTNKLVFHLPDARQPGTADNRLLAIALKELELIETNAG